MELSVKDVSSLFDRCPRLVYNIVQVGEAQLDEAVANNSDQASPADFPRSTAAPGGRG